jgi:hypothetical protein
MAVVTDITAGWPPRFLSKIDFSAGVDGCWIWTAGSFRNSTGDRYGSFRLDGKNQRAHRIAYEWATGEQLGTLFADHRCRNTLCVNPAHLRPATNKANQEHRGGANLNNHSSGRRGVSWYAPTQRWWARVHHNGKNIHAGYFATIEEAAEAVRLKRCELHTHNDIDRNA